MVLYSNYVKKCQVWDYNFNLIWFDLHFLQVRQERQIGRTARICCVILDSWQREISRRLFQQNLRTRNILETSGRRRTWCRRQKGFATRRQDSDVPRRRSTFTGKPWKRRNQLRRKVVSTFVARQSDSTRRLRSHRPICPLSRQFWKTLPKWNVRKRTTRTLAFEGERRCPWKSRKWIRLWTNCESHWRARNSSQSHKIWVVKTAFCLSFILFVLFWTCQSFCKCYIILFKPL